MKQISIFISRLVLALGIGVISFLTFGEMVRTGLLDIGATTAIAGLGKVATFVLSVVFVEQITKRRSDKKP
ncbi:hypothetical protein ACQU0X_16440 [Pseudovibrio ascidiaceicola]|jgi:hypothetical protein|uniref:hypothetical protein n=1 Tax=Pseudovibrio TaxID=258255 RepID=UPI0007B2BC9A|nr:MULTISPECIES: hypothetical protein [Pseudovibrio]KZK98395.1 hypothetical protein PsAD26_05312 [Pseudovibrio sp. Ad26]